jgi:dTDP-L-rhamnose 4-epimerase
VVNVGSGEMTTVLDVVNALFRAFGTTVPVTISGNFRVGDIRHNLADVTRSRELLGFQAGVRFDEGIERFVEWVRSEPLEEDGYERSLAEMAVRNLLQ